jgi:hypothetical protein
MYKYDEEEVFKLLKKLKHDYHNYQHKESVFNLRTWFNKHKKNPELFEHPAIVGYKLKDKYYKNGYTHIYQAAIFICGKLDGQIRTEVFSINKKEAILNAKRADILKHWFEPVYK